ncbi:GNAT family N-acetyltransferase [Corynebacterium sp. 153RC1]|uniref:GNAT family N-acetyltransferase n=1 Tax=Corynebacterium TaxID=1716 RepID=UPI00211BA973|nr:MULTISPECIES: GNAT family N-acetyltransferase [unclassified Corynebacterium]MCQ9343289.1 GNAT family N-acetyltransferase [Corynebacterium sp. 76QC2CO]MCQ9353208.1 GNAT family N-acetyltransferase [Corynebacterium sp. 209RC1]MCQ9355497.1 GNAT family N-acetyltransferase [Corynebacterium sp. 1222RC1]MCQ9357706.1 GNAT family N-acetyltransferase [Corynebacterium sp. 122RC1]MCQ9359913.1 GNAT family N-acetyltransferase [Corynebacterium sp. 142RC1]
MEEMQWPMPMDNLEGTRCNLRLLAPRDIPDMIQACSDPLTQRFTTIPHIYTEEMAQEFVAAERAWAIVDEDDVYCGHIELRLESLDNRTVNVGYLAAPWARGKGLTTDALKVVMAHAFRHGAHRFEVRCAVDNKASRAVARNAGATEEGILRGAEYLGGEFHDIVLHARLRPTE